MISSLKRRPCILVAEGDVDMRQYVTRLLEEGYAVESVSDGTAALLACRARRPDLVLSDVMMPKLDGLGLLRALRADPALASIPIILLSARAGEEARIEGAEAGADDYLSKPFSARELLARVRAQVRMATIRQESERRLRDFADTAPAMLWVTEADGSCSFISRGWYEFTGQTEEEGLGFGWLKAVHMDDREHSGRIFLEANRRHEPFVLDYRLRRVDGEYRWCLDAGRPRFDEIGIFQGYVGSVIDITERKHAEDALRASEERLRTFAGHLEILVDERTQELVQSQDRLRALATELNLAEQRERARLTTELHDYLQQMLVIGKLKLGQGKRLAGDIPDLAKIMEEADAVFSEALTYTRTLVADLSPIVLREHGLQAGLKWLGDSMREKQGLLVTVTAVDDSDLRLPEDQTLLLFQSVRELLINCWKYAQTKDVAVSLEHGNGELRITVSDNGVGFDPADDSSKDDGSSKFGLFSIRERMKALGGNCTIQSARGVGTTATLILPLLHQAREGRKDLSPQVSTDASQGHPTQLAEQQTPTAQTSSHQKSPSIRVLLVDDHIMMRQGLRTILDGYADIEVIGEAANGEEAVTLVDRLSPDVVIMDINMPKMDGIQATRLIKASHALVQIIGLSVNTEREALNAITTAGARTLLTKEAAVDCLYGTIREAMQEADGE